MNRLRSSLRRNITLIPDCGNAGTAIGADGYYPCTRFLTCWADINLEG